MTSPAPTTTELLGATGDQAVWKFQLSERGKSAITEISQADLAKTPDFQLSPWFQRSDDGTGVTLTAPVDGPTTSGSEYTRAEGRQQTLAGKAAAWDSSKGCTRFLLWMRIEPIPDGAKESLIQFHDDKDDQIQVLCQRTVNTYRLWWSVGQGKGKGGLVADIDTAAPVGTWFPILLEVIPGRTNLYYGADWSTPRVSTTKMRQSKKSYAKYGPYCQITGSKWKGVNLSASYRWVDITTTADVPTGPPARPGAPVDAPPVDPPPAQDPPPVVIPPARTDITVMIARHGEKPDSKHPGFTDITYSKQDSHSLTANGWIRARDLPSDVFGIGGTKPMKAGLVLPDVVIAADGPEAGERMLQTVSYLAPALGLAPLVKWDKGDGKALAAALKTMVGRAPYVSWEHSEIPEIAAALGPITPAPPTTWPDDRYDVIWVFKSTDSGKTWAFTQVLEAIGLPGEQKAPIK